MTLRSDCGVPHWEEVDGIVCKAGQRLKGCEYLDRSPVIADDSGVDPFDRLAFDTAAAWDKYISSDERPRPKKLWARAATLNDELLLTAKVRCGMLPLQEET